MRIVYIAHMGTVVLIVKISFIRFEENQIIFILLARCFTHIVYISHISKYDQLSSRSGPDDIGPKRA